MVFPYQVNTSNPIDFSVLSEQVDYFRFLKPLQGDNTLCSPEPMNNIIRKSQIFYHVFTLRKNK